MTSESFAFFFVVYLLCRRCPFSPSIPEKCSFLKSGEHKIGLGAPDSVKKLLGPGGEGEH